MAILRRPWLHNGYTMAAPRGRIKRSYVQKGYDSNFVYARRVALLHVSKNSSVDVYARIGYWAWGSCKPHKLLCLSSLSVQLSCRLHCTESLMHTPMRRLVLRHSRSMRFMGASLEPPVTRAPACWCLATPHHRRSVVTTTHAAPSVLHLAGTGPTQGRRACATQRAAAAC